MSIHQKDYLMLGCEYKWNDLPEDFIEMIYERGGLFGRIEVVLDDAGGTYGFIGIVKSTAEDYRGFNTINLSSMLNNLSKDDVSCINKFIEENSILKREVGLYLFSKFS